MMWRQPWERSNVEVPFGASDYTVYSDGSRVYVKENTSGHILIETDDFGKAINYILEEAGDYTSIFVKSGTYNQTESIVLDKNFIHISGAGQGLTIVQLSDELSGNAIQNASDGSAGYGAILENFSIKDGIVRDEPIFAIRYYDGSVGYNYPSQPVVIRNMYIYQPAGYGVYYGNKSSRLYMSNVQVYGFQDSTYSYTVYALYSDATDSYYERLILSGSYGIGLGGGTLSLHNIYVGGATGLPNKYLGYSAGYSMLVHGGEYTKYFTNSVFDYASKYNLYVGLNQNTGELVFVNTKFTNAKNANIVLGSSSYSANRNRFVNCIVGNPLGWSKDYGINEVNGDYNQFEGILFVDSQDGLASQKQVNLTGANSYIKSSVFKWNGKKSDNSGIATFSGDGSTTAFDIPHGLWDEPSKYYVIPISADATSTFDITVDATNITVTYKTAPPSGTDNIKLSWYAEV